MNEERIKILNMLSEGKISSEEADRLLETVENPKPVRRIGEGGDERDSDGLPKYLYVHVNSFNGDGEEKKQNVNIKVPMALIKAGVNIASLLPEGVQGEIDSAMSEKGFRFNLGDIKKENIDEFLLALRELEVNVDGDNEKVRIYCE